MLKASWNLKSHCRPDLPPHVVVRLYKEHEQLKCDYPTVWMGGTISAVLIPTVVSVAVIEQQSRSVMATGRKHHGAAISLYTKELPTCSSPFTDLMLCQQLLKHQEVNILWKNGVGCSSITSPYYVHPNTVITPQRHEHHKMRRKHKFSSDCSRSLHFNRGYREPSISSTLCRTLLNYVTFNVNDHLLIYV